MVKIKCKKIVKVLAVFFAVAAVTAGALCAMPDKDFQEISLTADAAETVGGTSESGLEWTLSNGKLTITGNGKIYANDTPWKDYISDIEEVMIGDGVTCISASAFVGYDRLTSITMYDTVTEMNHAFSYLPELTDVTILDSPNDPSSIGVIGIGTFYNSKKLKNVTILGDISSIEEKAFSGCTAIENMLLPEGLTYIGYRAFDGCSSLKNIVIPESTTFITSYAFINCSSLEKIIIPKNVTYIGPNAFFYCTSLKSAVILGNFSENIGEYLFNGCSALENVSFAEGISTISSGAFCNCTSLKSLVLPNSVRTINSYAFQDCTELESITLPTKLTNIGKSAFSGCSSLKSIRIPRNLNYISEYTFYNCNSLVNVIIPEGVSFISSFAFRGCEALEAISFPESLSVGNISTNATFRYCDNLTHIHIPTDKTYEDYAGKGGLPSVPEYYYPGGCEDEDCPLNVTVYGDINGDDVFDIDDVIDLARSILTTVDPADNPYLPAGDRDGNGKIDIDDVILLARELIM